jgi:hypothetical protein
MDVFRSNQARDGKLVFPLLGGSRYWGQTRDDDDDIIQAENEFYFFVLTFYRVLESHERLTSLRHVACMEKISYLKTHA